MRYMDYIWTANGTIKNATNHIREIKYKQGGKIVRKEKDPPRDPYQSSIIKWSMV